MALRERGRGIEKWPVAFNWPGTKSKAKEEETEKVNQFEMKMKFEEAVWVSCLSVSFFLSCLEPCASHPLSSVTDSQLFSSSGLESSSPLCGQSRRGVASGTIRGERERVSGHHYSLQPLRSKEWGGRQRGGEGELAPMLCRLWK